jgi:hypothetical protein
MRWALFIAPLKRLLGTKRISSRRFSAKIMVNGEVVIDVISYR